MSCPSCHSCSSPNTHRDPFAAKGCAEVDLIKASPPDEPQLQRYLSSLSFALGNLDNACTELENGTQFMCAPVEPSVSVAASVMAYAPENALSPLTSKLCDLMHMANRMTDRLKTLNAQLNAR